MEYIAYRRFKGRAICGDINLPAQTICESQGGTIMYRGNPICRERSENAHQFFARDDDGKGMERGGLILAIQDRLRKIPASWDLVWDDAVCRKYKRFEHPDHWLWNHKFYNAPIEDLQHIARLVGAKAKGE